MKETLAEAPVSIDSRTLQPGEVFYALRGERYDGHDFVAAALKAGAAQAVVEERELERLRAQCGREAEARLIGVEDTLEALQERARTVRRAWGGRLVAVTGSAGKTTTKEMIAAVLQTRLRTLKSSGNLNNHIGIPLTLLRLRPEHEAAVVEMGMNHAGEIARLAEIAEPDIGVFTNVGMAHVGHFDSIAGVAAAKRELAEAIAKNKGEHGTLVLNADDGYVKRFGEGFPGRTVYYRGAGDRREANAAAAAAVGGIFSIPLEAARAALQQMPALPGRGEVSSAGGVTLINDCYNANPEAMAYMLEVLQRTPAQRRIAVLGEMRELGQASAGLHRELGRKAAGTGLAVLIAVGGEAGFILEGARGAGFTGVAYLAADAAAAASILLPLLQPGDAVLFKASRGVRLETALERVKREVTPGK